MILRPVARGTRSEELGSVRRMRETEPDRRQKRGRARSSRGAPDFSDARTDTSSQMPIVGHRQERLRGHNLPLPNKRAANDRRACSSGLEFPFMTGMR